MITTDHKASIKGGEFLIKETEAAQVFIPEEFSEEQQMIAATCREFLEREIWPRLNEIDQAKSPELISSLMDKAGELGLLGTSVPEEYGGFGMNFNTYIVFMIPFLPIRVLGRYRLSITAMTNKRPNTCLSWLRVNGKRPTA